MPLNCSLWPPIVSTGCVLVALPGQPASAHPVHRWGV